MDAGLAENTSYFRVYWDSDLNGIVDTADPLLGSFVENKMLGRIQFKPDDSIHIYSKLRPNFETCPDYKIFLITGGKLDGPPRKLHFTFRNAVTGAILNREEVWDANSNVMQKPHYGLKLRTRHEFLSDNPQFSPSEQPDEVILKKGKYTFEHDIVVPMELNLRIEPGSVLRLMPGISLFSYSAVEAVRSEEEAILFRCSDPEKRWGVLAIIGPQEEKSRLKWARF